ncbi:GGDEF domain-containing protein [Fulvimonas yonginensis]|uniref:diguanylate cyclase n=1 Tax=Fulvimonas yonginensis TaxID=1495200 RepID=A0ABU8JDT4_9GAMM
MHRWWLWRALACLAACPLVLVRPSAAAIADPAAFLEQAEQLRTRDHPRFVGMLAQIHREAPRLTPGEQWHLRYLDAWQTSFQGDYAEAEVRLREVIERSGDATLTAKASALLMNNLGLNRRYEEAFTLASRLVADLPKIHDRLARFTVLANLSQSLTSAGQNDLAIRYARMMQDTLPPGETLCNPLSMEVTALYNAKRLSSASPELQRAIATCTAAGQPVFAETLWLVVGSLHLEEGHPRVALDLLRRLAPGIRTNGYYQHMLSSRTMLAQAYAALGDDDHARKAALAAVAMGHPDDIGEWLRDAYGVLYRIEKKRGHTQAALDYHERYVAQDKGYLDDIGARALAYQTVQQQVLSRELETEALSRQNNLLRLRQALDSKAVETGRLYNLLLLVTLVSIVFWLYRLKRSQLRFKKLSRLDGLTGIFNHQHFIGQAGRTLRLLERKAAPACLIALDLDHFKQINDTHGHAVGDAVLRHAVAVCQLQLRPADLFGRLGGEEFGILLQDCPRDRGMAIAHRIRAALERSPLAQDGRLVPVFASLGLACTDTCGHDVQRLHAEADAALYRAKRAGRNRVVADIEADRLAKA